MLQREAKDVKSIPVQKKAVPFQTLAPDVLSKINSYLTLRDNINWHQTNLFFNMAYGLRPSYSQYKDFITAYSNTIEDEKVKQQLQSCFVFEDKVVNVVLNSKQVEQRATGKKQQIIDEQKEIKNLQHQVTSFRVARFKAETFCKAFVEGKKMGFGCIGFYFSAIERAIKTGPEETVSMLLISPIALPIVILVSGIVDLVVTLDYFRINKDQLKNTVEYDMKSALLNITNARKELKLLQFVMGYMHHLDKVLQEPKNNFLVNTINGISDEKLKKTLHTALGMEEKLIVGYKKEIEKRLKLMRVTILKNTNAYRNQLIKTKPWLSRVSHQAHVVEQKVVENAKSSKTIAQKIMVPLKSYGIFVDTVYQNSVNEKRSPETILNEISQLMKEKEALQTLLERIQMLENQEADQPRSYARDIGLRKNPHEFS